MNEILNEDKVMPMFVTDKETGARFELDFSRESVVFAESRGFGLAEVSKFPLIRIPELFFYAFRKNHRKVGRNQTDALLNKMGGLSGAALERLIQLYQQAVQYGGVIQVDEEEEKNVTVEL